MFNRHACGQLRKEDTVRVTDVRSSAGENPSRAYSMSRMDTGWNFRQAYDTARNIHDQQDNFCAKAEAGAWKELGDSTFPEDLQWEALVDVLRGRVKLAVHCYEVRIFRTITYSV